MYTTVVVFNNKGWAFATNITYRWANRGYVEGTFYNAFSYFFGVQKKWNNGHSAASRHGAILLNAHRKEQAPTKFIGWINDYQYNPY